MHRTATISIFLSNAKCGPVCRAQTCAHSGIEPSRSAKAFLQGGPKTSKKIRIFHHFETLVHISQKLLKIEAYKQRGEKNLYISPIQLSHVFGPIGHVVLQGGPKMTDAKPVFSISPIVYFSQLSFLFLLNVVKCSRICRAETCAHSGVEPSTLAKGFLQGGPKIRIFDHF